jgi:hypothetical protein
MMFKTTAPDPLPLKVVEVPAADFIPLSHLSLDLDEPPIGWVAYLGNIGVEVVEDDIGRPALSRTDARMLIAEHHDNEVRKAELRAAAEKRAIEQDQAFRASLGHGVKVPDGMSYAEAARAAELDSQTYRPGRRSLVEDLLDNSGITYHPIAPTSEDQRTDDRPDRPTDLAR